MDSCGLASLNLWVRCWEIPHIREVALANDVPVPPQNAECRTRPDGEQSASPLLVGVRPCSGQHAPITRVRCPKLRGSLCLPTSTGVSISRVILILCVCCPPFSRWQGATTTRQSPAPRTCSDQRTMSIWPIKMCLRLPKRPSTRTFLGFGGVHLKMCPWSWMALIRLDTARAFPAQEPRRQKKHQAAVSEGLQPIWNLWRD